MLWQSPICTKPTGTGVLSKGLTPLRLLTANLDKLRHNCPKFP
jgi:hypothetical protein